MGKATGTGGRVESKPRGTIRQHKGALELRAYAGINPATGRQHYLTERVALDTSDREVSKRLAALVARADELAATRRLRRRDGGHTPRPAPARPGDRTVRDALEAWWDAHAQHLASADNVRMVLDTYLLPALGDVALWRLRAHIDREEAELDPDLVDLSAFEAELLRSGRTIRRRKSTRVAHRELRAANKAAGVRETAAETAQRARVLAAGSLVTERAALKPSAVERIHGILHAGLAYAVRKGWLPANPASDVKRAKVEDRESTTPEPEEAAAFLRYVAPAHPELYLFTLLVASGPRPQEVAALRWSHLDLDTGRLSLAGEGVIREKDPGAPERWVVRRGETHKRRRRVITLDAVTLDALRELHRERVELALACGAIVGRRSLVFSGEVDGSEPISPHAMTTTFSRYVTRARRDQVDVPAGMRLYDFRHFGITQLLRAGRSAADVAQRFGTSARVIHARYAHASGGDDERMAETMGGLWAGVRVDAAEPVDLEERRRGAAGLG